jgi:hypothetical protein
MSSYPPYPTNTLPEPAFAPSPSLASDPSSGVATGVPYDSEIKIRSTFLSPTSGEIWNERSFANHRLQPLVKYEISENAAFSPSSTMSAGEQSLSYSFTKDDVTGYFGHQAYTGTTRDFWVKATVMADGQTDGLVVANVVKPCPGINYVFTKPQRTQASLNGFLVPLALDGTPVGSWEDVVSKGMDNTANIQAATLSDNVDVIWCVDPKTAPDGFVTRIKTYYYTTENAAVAASEAENINDYNDSSSAYVTSSSSTTDFGGGVFAQVINPSIFDSSDELYLVGIPFDKWGPGYPISKYNDNPIKVQYYPFQFNECEPTDTYCINMFDCNTGNEGYVSQCYIQKNIFGTGEFKLLDEFATDFHSSAKYIATWSNYDGEKWMDEINVVDSSTGTGEPLVSVVSTNYNLNDTYGVVYSGTTGYNETEPDPNFPQGYNSAKLYVRLGSGDIAGTNSLTFNALRVLIP